MFNYINSCKKLAIGMEIILKITQGTTIQCPKELKEVVLHCNTSTNGKNSHSVSTRFKFNPYPYGSVSIHL